jgi:hypothetical protein
MINHLDEELDRLRSLEREKHKEDEVARLQKQFGKVEPTDREMKESELKKTMEGAGIPVVDRRRNNGPTTG